MVDPSLFRTGPSASLAVATARNGAGGAAYRYDPRHRLAQLAATGCLNGTYYASADVQLERVLALTQTVAPAFIARTAIFAREMAHMKDMPALLAASLAVRDGALLEPVFERVIDSGRMLRGFVQILRSGAVGRRSLGSRPKRLVQRWLQTASEKQLLDAAVGSAPSLADVVRMVHPKPAEPWRAAWFGWLVGRSFDEAALPPVTAAFERFKRDVAAGVDAGLPDVPFQMLTARPLTPSQWATIARAGSWQMARQNLNTFARHGVFDEPGLTEAIAAKLGDPGRIGGARVLPYQLLAAFRTAGDGVPIAVKAALERAMEVALGAVPTIEGRVVVCPDVSGSMQAPISGLRRSASSKLRCVDVAALVAAALLRKNPLARLLPFESEVVACELDARQPVMTNAKALAAIRGGGTNCSAPLALLNREGAMVDLVILVSDNESWVDARRTGATRTLAEWTTLKRRNPAARLVCLDIQPGSTTQAPEADDRLNIGGFSDAVFPLIADFAAGLTEPGHWVGQIEKVALTAR